MTKEQIAKEAKSILDNDVFKMAVENVDVEIIRDWKQAQSTEARERLWYAQHESNRLIVGLRKLVEQAR